MQKLHTRIEVMNHLATRMPSFLEDYIIPIDTNWQPTDFLPDASNDNFFDEIKELQKACKELPYDYWAVLIGDTITEEALPTYESWLMCVEGVKPLDNNGWARWVKAWTAEENRHGDLLNRFLYLSGKVNMRAVETSTQYLIADGFDIGTAQDPYKSFVYTSFQELATNISHRRTASLAKNYGSSLLSRICGQIAADELRHAKAYRAFISAIFEIDPSEMMIAFAQMMKQKIVMPAHFLREMNGEQSSVFGHFSDAAQRIGVYTTKDYISIMESLLKDWNISTMTGLNDEACKAQDYVMGLPSRFLKIAERTKIPTCEYKFSWVL
ncbi:acyl-ACP desaturase [Flectobacillus major]|uniref:acyl-ACP desaturase n=1 Tax=Flectobacillus major TaxID=103 RepID=UPI000426B601|nr:acyl-ACP desaturase [Flectobacillus major]